MKRDWSAALEKVQREGRCRACQARSGPYLHIEAAHVIGRRHDPNPKAVRAEDIVPLCRDCHREYDAHLLDLLPVLTLTEQAAAVGLVGLERARARIIGAERTPRPAYAGN